MQFLRIIVFFLIVFSLIYSQTSNKLPLQIIEFKGTGYSQKKLLSYCGLRKNQPIDETVIKRATDNLTFALHDEGFLQTRIDSVQTQIINSGKAVRLIFFGRTGEKVFFENINIFSDSLPSDKYFDLLNVRAGDVYSSARIEKDFNYLLNFAAEEGYAFAEIEVSNVTFHEKNDKIYANIDIKIAEGSKVFVNDILIQGNSYTKGEVVLRELEVGKGTIYNKSKVEQIPQRLNRLEIFKNVSIPVLLYESKDSVALQIEIEEGNATTFDGVVGYIPNPGSSGESNGYFTGLVDLSFNNLFGTARKFFVHWKKPDVYSEEFELYYTEPWVLSYPVDLSIGFKRLVRDTSFVEWESKVNTKIRLFQNLSFLGGLSRKTVYPDSTASRDLRLLRNDIINLEAGIEYDTRDYPVNPRSGLYYMSSYIYGLKNNLGPKYIIDEDSIATSEDLQSISLKFGLYYNLWSNQVVSMELTGMQVKGDRLQLTDYFWFGGSRSLRGYRENQFRGEIVSWMNLEYRFILNRNSRLFLFSDWGFYQNSVTDRKKDEILPGYGLGIRFTTPLGILGVDYGLGKGDGFGDGKIHFGIINRF